MKKLFFAAGALAIFLTLAAEAVSAEETIPMPDPETLPEISLPRDVELMSEIVPPDPIIPEAPTTPPGETISDSSTPDSSVPASVMLVTVDDYVHLVPAEERPPEPQVLTIPEEAEVLTPGSLPPPLPSSGQLSSILDLSLFIDPIAQSGSEPYRPSLPYSPPPVTDAYSYTPVFSAPQISFLERGKWYVQLGYFAVAENAENVLIRIGKQYPRAVQNTETGKGPRYSVLVGPVNKSESAALLQRFKNQGYKDAFLRSGS